MKLIEHNENVNWLDNQCVEFVFPVWSSPRGHECMFPISFYYIRTTADEFIVNINHIDANKVENFDISKYINENTLVFNNRYLNTIGLDYEYVYFEEYRTPFNLRELTDALYRTYRVDYTLLNDCIPLMKWYELLNTLENPTNHKDWYYKYSDNISALGKLEGAGVQVDIENFIDRFSLSPEYIDAGKVYTKYNPYTTTGRPSNHHLGINWAALNKGDGTRKNIISRFENGKLLQFDYESYHLRLIAWLVGYNEFKNTDDVHENLATQYGVDREAGKGITFKYLYGEIDELARTIPFFTQVDDYQTKMWDEFNTKGKILTPIDKREITKEMVDSSTKQKVFNYIIQALETEVNYRRIKKVLDVLENWESKLILYTYDAFLVDCHPNEKVGIIQAIKSIMETGGFHVKISAGKNYDSILPLK